MSDASVVKVGDELISLTDIGGIDLDGVEAVRFSLFPKGLFLWEIVYAELASYLDKDDNDVACARWRLKVVDVISLPEDEKRRLAEEGAEPESLVGREHDEQQGITEKKDIGRIVAFMEDVNFEGQGTLSDRLAAMIGFQFIGPIKHNPSKRDKTVFFANLDRSKLKAAA